MVDVLPEERRKVSALKVTSVSVEALASQEERLL